MDLLLMAFDKGLGQYTPQKALYWLQSGSLYFPRAIEAKNKNCTMDSLISS
jgi:hypothetical protein